MSSEAFQRIMRGLNEAKFYMDGEREGYKVTLPESVDVKRIRKGLKLTQMEFSQQFGFSLDAVKHWEGGRRTPESAARAYLTVIEHDAGLVLAALRRLPASSQASSKSVRKRVRVTSGGERAKRPALRKQPMHTDS